MHRRLLCSALSILLALLMLPTGSLAEWTDGLYCVSEIGLTIATGENWLIDDAKAIERINVMQMDDKITYPLMEMSMAKQSEAGLMRIELSYERTRAFSSAMVYASAMLVDVDRVFLQIGEKPLYLWRNWPELDFPGMVIVGAEVTWLYWIVQTQDGFYILQVTHPTNAPECQAEILELIQWAAVET